MPEETVVAAPSAVETKVPVEIPRSGTPEYAQWRVNGELPEAKPKTEDSAPSSVAGESETPKPQENSERPKKPGAEQRIRELAAKVKRLEAEAAARSQPVAEPAPKPQPVQQQPQGQRPKPTIDGKNAQGKPYPSYEEYTEDLAGWIADQRVAQYQRQQQESAQRAEVAKKVEAAKARYENFDEISRPFVKSLVDDASIPMAVKVMVSESEIWPDLVFTIAGDAQETAKFLEMAKTNPGKAFRYIAKVESLIQEELGSAGKSAERNGKGQFTSEKPPAKRGPESAPAPPIEIGNRGAGNQDEETRALSAHERGDPNAFRDWKRAQDRKDLARRRGQ